MSRHIPIALGIRSQIHLLIPGLASRQTGSSSALFAGPCPSRGLIRKRTTNIERKNTRYFPPIPILAIAFFLLLVLLPISHAATPVPNFPNDGMAVAEVQDTFGSLRTFLGTFQSQVDAKYTLCIVRVSDPQGRTGRQYSGSAVNYVDQVFESWRSNLDPAKHVLLLMAMENRGIAVHPGSNWTALGFEQGTIAQVIDNSSFARYARAGDYAGALKRLVEAIDWHLVLQSRAQQRRYESAKATLRQLKSKRAALAKEANSESFDVSAVHRRLKTVDHTFTKAEQALAQEDLASLLRLGGEANRTIMEAQERLESARERQRLLAQLAREAPEDFKRALKRRQAFFKRLRAAPFNSAQLQKQLGQVDTMLDEARAFQEKKDWHAMNQKTAATSAALDVLHNSFNQSAQHHQFITRTLPTAAGGLFLFILALIIIALRLVRSRHLGEATRHLKQWQFMLERAVTRLVELEDEHPILFGSQGLADRFKGDTAAQFKEVGNKVDELFVSYATAQQIVNQAERRKAEAGWLRWQAFLEVTAMLTSGSHVVSKERVKGRGLFLPEFREITRTAEELLEYMNTAYKDVHAQVAALEKILVEVPETLHAAQQHLSRAEEYLEDPALEPLQLKPYTLRSEALNQQKDKLSNLAETDPVGAKKPILQLALDAKKLKERLANVTETIRILSEAAKQLNEVEARILEQRKAGMRMEEPGFEPEVMGQASRELSAQALQVLEAGEDQAGLELAQKVQNIPPELERLLQATLTSKKETPKHITKLRSLHAFLAAKLPERHDRIRQLQAAHADEALQPALDNAEEAQTALAFASRCTDEAEQGLRTDQQRYLAAAELAQRARRTLTAVEDLYKEIESKASELAAAKREATKALSHAEENERELQGLLTGGDRFISAETHADLQEMRSLLDGLRSDHTAKTQKPHWPLLEGRSKSIQSMSKEVLDLAQAEKTAMEEALELKARVITERDQLGPYLEAHVEDRFPANQRFNQATHALTEFEAMEQKDRLNWIEAHELIRWADRQLVESRHLANEDIAAARAARAAIVAAVSEQADADAYYGHGVHADLDTSRNMLIDARNLLRSRNYEQALRNANTALAEARAAARDAREEARRKARRKAEQRRRAAARRSSSSWSSSGSSSFGSSFGSSSSGSSFGSSSGGSSFGSSSGGSSFGSSSGGSSW